MTEKKRAKRPDHTPATVPMRDGDFIEWVKIVMEGARQISQQLKEKKGG